MQILCVCMTASNRSSQRPGIVSSLSLARYRAEPMMCIQWVGDSQATCTIDQLSPMLAVIGCSFFTSFLTLILNLHVLLFHYCLKYPSRCSQQSISFPAIQASLVFQLAPHTCSCSGLWEREHCTHFTDMKQTQRHLMASSRTHLGCPGGSAGKESACKAGDLGSIPGLGRSPGEGKGYPLLWPRELHGLYSPWCPKESDTTERLSLQGHTMDIWQTKDSNPGWLIPCPVLPIFHSLLKTFPLRFCKGFYDPPCHIQGRNRKICVW